MANKPKKAKKSSAASRSDSNVVRIKASTAPASKSEKKAEKAEAVTKVAAKPVKATKKPKSEKAPKAPRKRGVLRPLVAVKEYFVGAWVELRQVRWPNRRATWSMTLAVLVYSAFFVALILLLDAGFNYLFDLILGK